MKMDSNIVPSLFFSHFFIFFIWAFSLFYGLFSFSFFIWASLASFIFMKSEVSSRLVGESQSSSSFPHLRQCSNEDHHTFIDLQLKNYKSKIEQDMTLYECLRRCTGICNESRATCMKIMKVALPQIRCQLHDHAKSNMTMMKRVIINGMVESCMAIYLGMAMEMP